MEIFKEIKEFEDYEVSNFGNVRNLKRNRILKPNKDNCGYYKVDLCKDGHKHTKRVHRLVAEAFIPNPNNLPCINHKDENKLNNKVENLEWCSYKYNNNYGTIKERSVEKRRNYPLISKPVVAVDDNGNVVMEFPSMHEAERNGFKNSNVSACCRNCYSTHKGNFYKGYRWYYKEDWLKMQQATHDRVACGKLKL